MATDLTTAEYNCHKCITGPEVFKFLRDIENDPSTPSAKDLLYELYQKRGIDVDYDEIFE